MRTLIVGAGIAGATVAYWLRRAGHVTTLVEQSPTLRQGGYLIDFWGAGFDVAEQMGIVPDLTRRGLRLERADQVDRNGRRFASIDPASFVANTGERYVSIGRGDLAATLYEAALSRDLPGPSAELLLGEEVRALVDDGTRVRVEFARAGTRDFDLVVGADGLHSAVRRLVFGPEDDFAVPLGLAVAAYDIDRYRSADQLDARVATMYAEVGMQAARVRRPDGVTMVLLSFRHDASLPARRTDQESFLLERLAGAGWQVADLLVALPDASTLYLDRMSQIRMPSWSRGRVVLVGDAAACVSPLAGQGSALAMVEAYVLAAELDRCGGEHAAAFAAYEGRLRTLLDGKQRAARGLGLVFAPRNRRQLVARNLLLRMLALRFVSDRAYGGLQDAIELPAAAGG